MLGSNYTSPDMCMPNAADGHRACLATVQEQGPFSMREIQSVWAVLRIGCIRPSDSWFFRVQFSCKSLSLRQGSERVLIFLNVEAELISVMIS
jgi:hypothetical protein